MNKKALITSVVLITISIVGVIPSAIMSMPDVTNIINEIRLKTEQETLIYNKKENISKVNVDLKNISLEIKESNNDSVYIKHKGYKIDKNFEIYTKENELNIIEKESYETIKTNMDMKDYFYEAIDELYGYKKQLVLYVPNKADFDISTIGGGVYIEDDVVKEALNYKTNYGNITLDADNKNIKTLNIKSRDYIRLSLNELRGIENVNIECGYFEVLNNHLFSDEYLADMPENVTVRSEDVYITCDLPISKNLNIYNEDISNNGHTSLELPYMTYNINLDLKSGDQIYFDDYDESESLKTYKGTLNKIENEKSYSVNVISSGTIYIEK